MDFKFDVLQQPIATCPMLHVGDAVFPTNRMTIAPGGYEYDTWQKLVIGTDRITVGDEVLVRIDHRGKFMECTVNGDTFEEIIEKVKAICNGVKGGSR